MLVGYAISGQYNGAYFFEDAPEGVLCPNCGTCLDYSYSPKNLEIPSSKYDVSATYDCRGIYSMDFIRYLSALLTEIEQFHQVSTKPDFFYLIPSRILEFDPARRKTRFKGRCEPCGGFVSIVGATPAYVKANNLEKSIIYRTDLAFGSGKEKFPLTIVDPETKDRLARAGFSGLNFNEVRSSMHT